MTHVEASTVANHFVRSALHIMVKNGYAYPAVFAASKKRMMKTEINHSHVTNQDSTVMSMLDMEIYLNVYIIKIETVTDEDYIIPISKKAVVADPDMIGVVSCCLYQLYDKPANIARIKLMNDPEAARVITGYYYLKDDTLPRDIDIPYIASVKSDEKNDIFPAYSGWYIPEKVKSNRNPFC